MPAKSPPSARRTKSKARLAAFDELVNQAERAKQTFAQIQLGVAMVALKSMDRLLYSLEDT